MVLLNGGGGEDLKKIAEKEKKKSLKFLFSNLKFNMIICIFSKSTSVL